MECFRINCIILLCDKRNFIAVDVVVGRRCPEWHCNPGQQDNIPALKPTSDLYGGFEFFLLWISKDSGIMFNVIKEFLKLMPTWSVWSNVAIIQNKMHAGINLEVSEFILLKHSSKNQQVFNQLSWKHHIYN